MVVSIESLAPPEPPAMMHGPISSLVISCIKVSARMWDSLCP